MPSEGAHTSTTVELPYRRTRCSVFVRLMMQPFKSKAEAAALPQIGPLKDFISKRVTQLMWRVNLTIMKGSINKCRRQIKEDCSERLQRSDKENQLTVKWPAFTLETRQETVLAEWQTTKTHQPHGESCIRRREHFIRTNETKQSKTSFRLVWVVMLGSLQRVTKTFMFLSHFEFHLVLLFALKSSITVIWRLP